MPMPFRSTGVGLLIISGDTLHGQDALAASGSAGSALALVGGAGDGAGAGGVVSINAGAAGASGVGGAITLQAGAGGGSNSAGGAITITSGTGSATNGAGGALALAGGVADGSGIGGAVTIDGGAADVSGTGGGVTVSGADGGSSQGDGGAIFIVAGDAPTLGAGGSLGLQSGSGANFLAGGLISIIAGTGGATAAGGAIVIVSGDGGSTSGAGGALTLNAGDASAGNSAGGVLTLRSGRGIGTSSGGAASLTGGIGGATAAGGQTLINGGAGGGTSGSGGGVFINGGTVTSGLGGNVNITGANSVGAFAGVACQFDAGDAGTVGNGGGILITSGAGGSTSGNGGLIQLTAAAAPTSGDGGDIELRAGAGTDDNGRVIITPNFSNDDTDEYVTLVGTGSNPPNSGGTQDVRILAGNRDPDESVIATPGSLYLRGSSTGSLLYVNITSGTAAGSSWTQLAAGTVTRQQAYDGGATVVTGGAIAWSTTGSASWELKSSAAAGAIEGTLVTVTGTGSSGGVAITASNAAGFIVVDAGGSISMISQTGDTTITSATVLELNAVTRVDMDTPELAWGDGTTAATVTWTTTTGQPNEAQPTGSIKIVNGASIGQVWSKVGTGNTDWDLLNGGVSVPVFAVSGVLTTGGKPFRYRSRVAGTIVRVQITAGTAPTGATIIADVNKGGTTIFTTQSNRPVIAIGAQEGNTTTIEVATVAVNDEFTVSVDQIGSTIAGSDLLVEIEIAVNQ